MKKKIVTLMMAVSLISLCACGNTATTEPSANTEATTEASANTEASTEQNTPSSDDEWTDEDITYVFHYAIEIGYPDVASEITKADEAGDRDKAIEIAKQFMADHPEE